MSNKIITAHLKDAQYSLENKACNMINDPMIDFDQLRKAIDLLERLDTLRRELYHFETFGDYESMASNFTADDIPF